MHNEYIDKLLGCSEMALTVDRAFVAFAIGIMDGFDFMDDRNERMNRLIDAYSLLTGGKRIGFREIAEYDNVDIDNLPVLPKSMGKEYYREDNR